MPRRRRGRGRRRGPGRPIKERNIEFTPSIRHFIPAIPKGEEAVIKEPIFLTLAELEALRLVDLEGLMQQEAGDKMDVSRGTIWRILQRARRKITRMLIEGRELIIVPET